MAPKRKLSQDEDETTTTTKPTISKVRAPKSRVRAVGRLRDTQIPGKDIPSHVAITQFHAILDSLHDFHGSRNLAFDKIIATNFLMDSIEGNLVHGVHTWINGLLLSDATKTELQNYVHMFVNFINGEHSRLPKSLERCTLDFFAKSKGKMMVQTPEIEVIGNSDASLLNPVFNSVLGMKVDKALLFIDGCKFSGDTLCKQQTLKIVKTMAVSLDRDGQDLNGLNPLIKVISQPNTDKKACEAKIGFNVPVSLLKTSGELLFMNELTLNDDTLYFTTPDGKSRSILLTNLGSENGRMGVTMMSDMMANDSHQVESKSFKVYGLEHASQHDRIGFLFDLKRAGDWLQIKTTKELNTSQEAAYASTNNKSIFMSSDLGTVGRAIHENTPVICTTNAGKTYWTVGYATNITKDVAQSVYNEANNGLKSLDEYFTQRQLILETSRAAITQLNEHIEDLRRYANSLETSTFAAPLPRRATEMEVNAFKVSGLHVVNRFRQNISMFVIYVHYLYFVFLANDKVYNVLIEERNTLQQEMVVVQAALASGTGDWGSLCGSMNTIITKIKDFVRVRNLDWLQTRADLSEKILRLRNISNALRSDELIVELLTLSPEQINSWLVRKGFFSDTSSWIVKGLYQRVSAFIEMAPYLTLSRGRTPKWVYSFVVVCENGNFDKSCRNDYARILDFDVYRKYVDGDTTDLISSLDYYVAFTMPPRGGGPNASFSKRRQFWNAFSKALLQSPQKTDKSTDYNWGWTCAYGNLWAVLPMMYSVSASAPLSDIDVSKIVNMYESPIEHASGVGWHNYTVNQTQSASGSKSKQSGMLSIPLLAIDPLDIVTMTSMGAMNHKSIHVTNGMVSLNPTIYVMKKHSMQKIYKEMQDTTSFRSPSIKQTVTPPKSIKLTLPKSIKLTQPKSVKQTKKTIKKISATHTVAHAAGGGEKGDSPSSSCTVM